MTGWKKCRKKPMTVYCHKLTVDSIDLLRFTHLIRVGYDYDVNAPKDKMLTVKVATPEGEMTGHEGDYLMRGVEGEYYICKASIFKKTYDILDDTE